MIPRFAEGENKGRSKHQNTLVAVVQQQQQVAVVVVRRQQRRQRLVVALVTTTRLIAKTLQHGHRLMIGSTPLIFNLKTKRKHEIHERCPRSILHRMERIPSNQVVKRKIPAWKMEKTIQARSVNKIGKIAIHLEAPGATEQYQQELYTSRSDKPKEKLQSWAALNRFLEDVITKRQPDYAAKRDKMMAVRAVHADGGKSGGSGSGSTGGKSGTGGKSFGTPSLNSSTNL